MQKMLSHLGSDGKRWSKRNTGQLHTLIEHIWKSCENTNAAEPKDANKVWVNSTNKTLPNETVGNRYDSF